MEFSGGYYYVRLVNRTSQIIQYEALNDVSGSTIKLEPQGTITHWWSSADIAQIRLVDTRKAKRGKEPWWRLETKRFEHIVPRGSTERELVPLVQFVKVGGEIVLTKVASTSTPDESRAREKEFLPSYSATFSNKTGVGIEVDHWDGEKWCQFKLSAREGTTVYSETDEIRVRLCPGDPLDATAPDWAVPASAANEAPLLYEFYRERSGKVNLRDGR